LRRSTLTAGCARVRIPLGPLFIFKHIEKVDPYSGLRTGSNPPGSTFFNPTAIEKVSPLQGWVHKKSTFIGAFVFQSAFLG